MKMERDDWLDRNAVFCRVFKGRWSIRHCLKIYCEIKDLKIEMAIRAKGGVKRLQSTYNPCENCAVLAKALKDIQPIGCGGAGVIEESNREEKWAACG
ncbi:MAG: hypothetical protein V1897_12290 [Pseudomonadota bacterium]